MITLIILPCVSAWSQRLLLRTWITAVKPPDSGDTLRCDINFIPLKELFPATYLLVHLKVRLSSASLPASIFFCSQVDVVSSSTRVFVPVPKNQQLHLIKTLQDVTLDLHSTSIKPALFRFFFLSCQRADCNLEGTLRAEGPSPLQSNCFPSRTSALELSRVPGGKRMTLSSTFHPSSRSRPMCF